MTFLTILGVTEIILCSFRLVLEGKMSKKMPEWSKLEFLQKFLANNFVLSDADNNTSWLWNRGGIVDLPLLRTLSGICQKSKSQIDSCFISICKFGSFKNPFPMVTGLSDLSLRLRRFILLVETKNTISMNYGGSTSSWKPWRWVRLDLILMLRDIYISSNLNPLTKFTSSSRSIELIDIFPWNISLKITKTIPVSTRIVISYTIKQGISFLVWGKVNANWDNNMIRISQWRKSYCRKNSSVRR